jgi:hypothetical protein
MQQINIADFFGYNQSSFMKCLEQQKDKFITLVIPKEYSEQDGELIATDYYRLFYIMQQLMPICHDLLHSWPDPSREGEFHVMLHTEDWEELKGFLWEVMQGYDMDNNFDAYTEFELTAIHMNKYMEHGELMASPGLYDFIMNIHDKYAG